MDDNKYNDLFDEENLPEEIEVKPKVETPAEREEREISESTIERRHHRFRNFLICLALLIVVACGLWFFFTYLHPYSEVQERGVIVKMESRGMVIKTYEGQMLSEKRLIDTTNIYRDALPFTVKDDSIAAMLQTLNGTGRRVLVSYVEYKGHLPWRGETSRFVTKVELDTAGYYGNSGATTSGK